MATLTKKSFSTPFLDNLFKLPNTENANEMKYLAAILLFSLVAFGSFKLTSDRSFRTVLGVSTQAYRSATVSWNKVAGAAGYSIYYKQQSDKTFTFSVRNLPASSTSYTINYLKKNQSYQYVVKAFNQAGAEFWTSQPMWIWNFN